MVSRDPRSIQGFIPMRIPTVTHNALEPGMRKGKPCIRKSARLKNAEAHWEAHLAKLAEQLDGHALSGALMVQVRFAFQADERHSAGTPHTSKPDADNLEKTLWDVLQRLGVIEDDRRIFDKRVSKLYADVPGVYVRIEEVTLNG